MVHECIRKRVGVLYRLRQFMSRRVLLLLYKTFGEVWGSNYEKNMKCLLLSQKMALRVITFSPIRTHSQPIFRELKLLNMYQLHKLSICVFMYQLLNDKLPQSISLQFIFSILKYTCCYSQETRYLWSCCCKQVLESEVECYHI